MISPWKKWLNHREQPDYWQTSPDTYSYGWLKKVVIAALLFLAVYEMHITNTVFTPYIDNGVKYILNTEIELSYFAEQVKEYASLHNIDLTALNKVKTTLSRPADPLFYMQKPSSGKIIVPYGWRTDAALKREVMQEGIIFAASQSENVTAAAAGTVKIVTENAQYGKILIIEHGRNIETLYGNLREVLVAEGEMISQGQIIGKVITNSKVLPTVYFEIHENGKAIDPLKRLRGQTAEGT
ncbi:MAG: M23 family metallopeptidase [Pelosinus sp.]|nr:M23 family metallopeptidase [Pelosinus sp.]